ncbi:Hypothetical_protein [Hexamita inflata]|uniref:Hypothetical_protein n=1 Tax=Hexamita inflata TaxID=28002 RepID=A0AA86VA16_9EUKA|nr:Hypothetical protein HINF_LOCUS14331 [Hexamita inflata]CAI9926691.1 Hypothetical protein HINF_LOCUS14336 [Hexamita inflata]CAI9960658.1 Hypothetical protein HINF_LOCUS48303 [Hexamita inflata]
MGQVIIWVRNEVQLNNVHLNILTDEIYAPKCLKMNIRWVFRYRVVIFSRLNIGAQTINFSTSEQFIATFIHRLHNGKSLITQCYQMQAKSAIYAICSVMILGAYIMERIQYVCSSVTFTQIQSTSTLLFNYKLIVVLSFLPRQVFYLILTTKQNHSFYPTVAMAGNDNTRLFNGLTRLREHVSFAMVHQDSIKSTGKQ